MLILESEDAFDAALYLTVGSIFIVNPKSRINRIENWL